MTTSGEYRAWASRLGTRALAMLKMAHSKNLPYGHRYEAAVLADCLMDAAKQKEDAAVRLEKQK